MQPDAREKKARCEEVNKAMAVCAGKKAGDELNNCLKESRLHARSARSGPFQDTQGRSRSLPLAADALA